MSNLKKLKEKKKALCKEIDEINEEMRLKKLKNFVKFLHQQKQDDMLEQNFDAHHEMMEKIVALVDVCLSGTETKAFYYRFSEVIINNQVNMSDREDYICLSDDYAYLYDVISFFEKEAQLRTEGKKEEVWINDNRLDNFLLGVEEDFGIEFWWYDDE